MIVYKCILWYDFSLKLLWLESKLSEWGKKYKKQWSKLEDTLLIYKTVAKWYFFTIFIYANHIFNRLNSLKYDMYSLILHNIVASSNLECKTKKARQ